jgi:hypothetical protein
MLSKQLGPLRRTIFHGFKFMLSPKRLSKTRIPFLNSDQLRMILLRTATHICFKVGP